MSYEVWGEPDDMPECRSCEEAANDYEELEKVVDDLAQMVKRLSHSLREAAPYNDLSEKALDYLKRKELYLTPLREVSNAKLTGAALTKLEKRNQNARINRP